MNDLSCEEKGRRRDYYQEMPKLARFVILALAVCREWAQSSPEQLASAIVQPWSGNSGPGFEAVFPFAEGRKVFSDLARRLPGLASVIRENPAQAVVLLSGVGSAPNS